MNVFLWILQIVLAVAFVASGTGKLTQSKEKLAGNMAWVDDFSGSMIKTIGGLEVLGAVGLILPWAIGHARVLTPLAATGLVIIMIGAIVTHVRRKEYPMIGITAVLGVLALVVAIGRFSDL
jgi:uncharacterized membrane protein YphA (DoxX/SURF4 family)